LVLKAGQTRWVTIEARVKNRFMHRDKSYYLINNICRLKFCIGGLWVFKRRSKKLLAKVYKARIGNKITEFALLNPFISLCKNLYNILFQLVDKIRVVFCALQSNYTILQFQIALKSENPYAIGSGCYGYFWGRN
jgi:hypothetical protein